MKVELSKEQKLRLMEMIRLVLMSRSYESIELDGGYNVTIELGDESKILLRQGYADRVYMHVKTSDLETKFRAGCDPVLFALSRKQRLFNKIKEEIDRLHRTKGKSIISKVADAVDTAPALGFAEELDRLTAETASG